MMFLRIPEHSRVKRTSRRLVLGALSAALAIAPLTAGAADPVEINAIIAQTGGGAFLGAAQMNVFQAIEHNVNKAGGIAGRPIKFVIHDDTSNPQTTVQLLSMLIAQKVPVVLGSTLTASCEAMVPLVKNGPVMYCFSPGIAPATGSYAFTSGVSFHDQGDAIFRYFRANGVKRVAVLATTDASGIGIAHSFDEELAEPANAGIRVVARETYNPSDLTVSAQMARIKTAKPDLLLSATAGTPTGTLLHGMTEGGLADLPVVLGAGNESYAQMKVYASFLPKNVYFPGIASLVEEQITDPQTKALVNQYKKDLGAFGVRPDYLQTTAWDQVMIVIAALKKIGPAASADQIRDYIVNLTGFVGVNGPYNMKVRPQRGLDASAIYMVRWDPAKGTWIGVSGPDGAPLKH
jgi:branched-chain amino acid transport system substrate-binding protein